MKNVSTVKSETDSPKTPGGISKSLLTPCRRVGLSRNFRKSGASPFKSPLSSKIEVKQENVETLRKRKESLEDTPQTPNTVDDSGTSKDGNVQTPIRKIEEPRRKKSKTLINSINKNSNENNPTEKNVAETFNKNSDKEACENLPIVSGNKLSTKCTDMENTSDGDAKQISTPLHLIPKSKTKNTSPKSYLEEASIDFGKNNLSNNALSVCEPKYIEKANTKKSPDNLTKECIVVIQKKIFKKNLKSKEKSLKPVISPQNTKERISQPLFDSDSDMPLNSLNKDTKNKPPIVSDDEDFIISKTKIGKPVKSKSKQKKSPAAKPKNHSKVVEAEIHQVLDSDDDDDFKKKKSKTILIRKTYDKVTQPLKMKSTGSISQKDIDDLNSRIEFKKKLLLARAASEDTKEVMDLIKKWHKGCQDSLIQLMDLMKSKTDNQSMGYSEILQTLKIPSSLVGYDSETDCFLTPDDETILGSLV